MIRYHRSLNHKLCQLEIGGCLSDSVSIECENKVFGFRGEYGRMLKLKEIDGRAPPGVEPAA